MDQQATGALPVEVAYATKEKQHITTIEVADGSTVRDAVRASDLAVVFPEVDFSIAPLGVWGEACGDDTLVRAGDRVEVYRVLANDPRALRMQLAAQGKTMGGKRD